MQNKKDEALTMEEIMDKSLELMNELEEIENRSLSELYENKEKFEKLIEYSNTLNLFDYNQMDLMYKELLKTDKKSSEQLKEFIVELQKHIFEVNMFTNTFIENIINYEMVIKLLPDEDLNVSTEEIYNKLMDCDSREKQKLVSKKLNELS